MAQIHAYHPAKKQVAAIFKYPLESRWCDSPCLPILMSLKPPGRIIPHPSLLTLICLGFGISLQTGQITGERTGSESKLAFYVGLILLAQWTDQRERMSVWPWLWYGCGEPGPTRTAIVSATGASENAEAKSCTGEQAMVCPPPHTHSQTVAVTPVVTVLKGFTRSWVRKSWGNISLTSRKWKSHSQFWTEFLVWKWGLLLTM